MKGYSYKLGEAPWEVTKGQPKVGAGCLGQHCMRGKEKDLPRKWGPFTSSNRVTNGKFNKPRKVIIVISKPLEGLILIVLTEQ